MPREPADSRATAIVVGAGLNGLGVVRSLGARGVPVIVLDKDPGAPAMRSRYAKALRVGSHGGEKVSGEDVIDSILRLASRLPEEPVLFLTQEETVAFVSEQRARLGNQVRFSFPPHEVMETLLDKTLFQRQAESLGFPVPRSVSVSGPGELSHASSLTFPCIVKPVTKDPLWGSRFKKAYEVASFDELATIYQPMAELETNVIVQEWIAGEDLDVYFCLQYRDRDGKTRASFTGRKLRQWPPLVGGTASCMPAPDVANELEPMTSRFFDMTGFIGLGSMEYKRDRRTGRFFMVEPTVGRSDYQEEVATLNGCNIIYEAYRSECGLAPEDARNDIPGGRMHVWRDPFGDVKSAASQGQEAILKEMRDCRIVDAYWRWHDPAPWIGLRLDGVRSRLRRLSGFGT